MLNFNFQEVIVLFKHFEIFELSITIFINIYTNKSGTFHMPTNSSQKTKIFQKL